MALTNQHAVLPLINRDSTHKAESEYLRQQAINRLKYLLDNVDPADKNTLITSKFRKLGIVKFDLAKSLVAGDEYFKSFIPSLSFPELQHIMSAIQESAMSGVKFKAQTSAAFNHIFKDQIPNRPSTVMQEAVDTFGKYFAGTLRAEEDKQYQAANQSDPDRGLEERELKLCGNPCEGIFKRYLPELSASDRARFNALIRKTLLNDKLSTYTQQGRLLYTAGKLAEALNNEEKKQSAKTVVDIISRSGYENRTTVKNKVLDKRSIVNDIVRSKENPFYKLWNYLTQLPKLLINSPALLFSNKGNTTQAQTQDNRSEPIRIRPKPLPIRTEPLMENTPQQVKQQQEYDSAAAMRSANDLYARLRAFAAQQATAQTQQEEKRAIEQIAAKPKEMTFAYQGGRPTLLPKPTAAYLPGMRSMSKMNPYIENKQAFKLNAAKASTDLPKMRSMLDKDKRKVKRKPRNRVM